MSINTQSDRSPLSAVTSGTAQPQIFDVTFQPQVKTRRTVRVVMLDVIIALIPTLLAGLYEFGMYNLIPVAVSVAACVFFEWGYRKLLKKDNRIWDLSACVTGLILGLSLPPDTGWWIAVIGAFFAIVVVKQLYGGIGKNFLNPALTGRAFLIASYALIMSLFSVPRSLAAEIDAATMATPLTYMYSENALPEYFTLKNMFLGAIPGSIGEVSKLALLIGLAYLLIRKIITWRIPVSFMGTIALLTVIFGKNGYGNFEWMLLNLCTGSALLTAVFMATDYATSPVTANGQLLYGFGCGALTVLIRYFGGYPEGSTFAVLIMNLCAWAIDKGFHRRPFGLESEKKGRLSGRRHTASDGKAV